MSQNNNEHLSALMDGEHDSNEIIASVHKDPSMRASWERYHLVRATLRKEVPEHIHLDIATAVASAIDAEPAIVAPKKSGWRSLPGVAQVLPLVSNGGQYAVAAAVALAVVMGVQQLNQPDEIMPGGDAMPFGIGVQGGLSPVSLERTEPANPRQELLEEKRRINALLNDHQQQMRLKQMIHDSDVIPQTESQESQPQ